MAKHANPTPGVTNIATQTTPRTFFARYGALVIATTLFLALITAILLGGMYFGERVNRHRLMSITITHTTNSLSEALRDVFDIHVTRAQNRPAELQRLHDSLRNAMQRVDQGLHALQSGGPASGVAPGSTIQVAAATDTAQRTQQDALQRSWQPFKAAVDSYFAAVSDGSPGDAALNSAIALAQANADEMVQTASAIDGRIRALSRGYSDRGTQIETVGISLAILYFILFTLYFMRTLWHTDRKVLRAQRETQGILDTVQEGLFLLDRDLRIGSQHSRSLETVLDRAIAPGDSLKDYLRQKLSRQDYESSVDYIELLFSEHVIEELIGDINPLDQLEILDKDERRYLSFEFNRVHDDTRHLLVTVQDITRQVKLTRELETARRNANNEMTVMFDMLETDRTLLRSFIDNARTTLRSINQRLENVQRGQQHEAVNTLFRDIHTLKGEAATLSLGLFEQTFQSFENTLRTLRDNPQLTGEDLLTLIPHLETSFARLDQADQLIARVTPDNAAPQQPTVATPASEISAFTVQLERLAKRIASDYQKEVALHTNLAALTLLESAQRQKVRDIITQCVRNAVVHGIEAPERRQALGKPIQGQLRISLDFIARNRLSLECGDDGHGIDIASIREKLRNHPAFTAEQITALSDEDVARTIFDAGFSTATPGGRDAGQGVGLPVVRERAEELGGRVRIHSRPDEGTSFEIQFPAQVDQP